jgi:hypothetical protein
MTALNITTAGPELQDAVYAALTGDDDHMALVTGVYDHVPDAADDSFPFESFAALSETWADGFTDGFRSITLQIDVWSRYKGRTEAQAIQASQIALLNRQALTLATLHCVYIRLDYSEVLEDPDGQTWHGVTRYMALVEATS